MEDRWFGKALQIFEATDENDLEAAMVVLRGGTQIERDKEERSGRTGTYLGMRSGSCLSLSVSFSEFEASFGGRKSFLMPTRYGKDAGSWIPL